MGKKKPDCNTCIYRAVNRAWKCNFESIIGRTRRAVPAKRCKEYKKGDPVQRNSFELMEKLRRAENAEKTQRKPQGPKEKYDWSIAKRLYDEGKNDGEISRVMGCTPGVVHQWRVRNKLPRNTNVGWRGKQAKYDWEKGRQLYDEGKGDGEIAKELGCSNKTVRNWRKRRALPARRAPGGQKKEKTT